MNPKKVLSVVALAALAFTIGCACDGEAGGKVAGSVSASDQVYPWAGPSTAKPAARARSVAASTLASTRAGRASTFSPSLLSLVATAFQSSRVAPAFSLKPQEGKVKRAVVSNRIIRLRCIGNLHGLAQLQLAVGVSFDSDEREPDADSSVKRHVPPLAVTAPSQSANEWGQK